LWKIQVDAFNGRVEVWSTPWERESIFRTLGGRIDLADEPDIIQEALCNPLWPDGNLDPDWSPLAPSLMARLEAEDYDNLFDHGDSVLLHCHETYANKGARSDEFEAIACLVPRAFFNGHIDRDSTLSYVSVHESWEVGKPETLAPLSEPAIIRYRPYPM